MVASDWRPQVPAVRATSAAAGTPRLRLLVPRELASASAHSSALRCTRKSRRRRRPEAHIGKGGCGISRSSERHERKPTEAHRYPSESPKAAEVQSYHKWFRAAGFLMSGPTPCADLLNRKHKE